MRMRKTKYGNKKTAGFDSKREAMRYRDLDLLQKAGEISELKTQVTFEVVPKQEGERAVKYIADFSYFDLNGNYVVEDVKSPATKTPAYVIKRKLMLHVHGIRVLETY
ncbi:MAG: DUF1064 domain-containing protein [Methanococcoides sp.]|nr:DUF1064 domain-containing protein [Methanococcoides sp.]